MNSPDDPTPGAAPRLTTAELELSTKIALVVLVAVLVLCVLSIWLPSPAGWIAAIALVYVGLTLGVLIVSDLGKLRQDRLIARRASLEGPTPDDPDLRVMLDVKALTGDQLQRWRAGRKWVGVIATVAIAIFLLAIGSGAPVLTGIVLAGIVLAVGWLRDLQLAIRLLDTLPKSAWGDLSRLERGWLRMQAGLLGLLLLSIWLGVVAIIAYLFSGHIPVRWNTFAFAFAFVYGAMGLAVMVGGRRWIALAFRALPGLDSDKVEVMRMTREVESPDNPLDPRNPQ